jgi:hypothetical protein
MELPEAAVVAEVVAVAARVERVPEAALAQANCYCRHRTMSATPPLLNR